MRRGCGPRCTGIYHSVRVRTIMRRRGEGGLYDDRYVGQLLSEYRRSGATRLRDEVVEHMRPLVVSVARRFAGREPQEDLESEGFLGLIRAVDRFEPDRGARFSTFATHLVAGQIRHYLRDRGHLIRQPAWLQELNTRVQRAHQELEQRLQRPPTIPELAAATNLTEEGIEELMAARQVANIARMEAPREQGEDDFLDVDPEKFRSREHVTLQLPIEDRVVLEATLDKLKDLERKVLQAFFFQEHNQSEIARSLGISCNYVGYLLRNGLKHMRERLGDRPGSGRVSRPEWESGDAVVIDPQSGAYTEEYFDRRLREEVTRAQCFENELSVICLRFGANVDPADLREAAGLIQGQTRRADLLGRTGPRELSIILPGTGSVAEKVAQRLAGEIFARCELRVHAASAVFPAAGRTPEDLLRSARFASHEPQRLPELTLAAALE